MNESFSSACVYNFHTFAWISRGMNLPSSFRESWFWQDHLMWGYYGTFADLNISEYGSFQANGSLISYLHLVNDKVSLGGIMSDQSSRSPNGDFFSNFYHTWIWNICGIYMRSSPDLHSHHFVEQGIQRCRSHEFQKGISHKISQCIMKIPGYSC